MRIAVDAMGGDHAPDVVIDGAVAAARKYGTHVILVGDRDVLAEHLDRHDVKGLPLSVHHASEQVEMDESPSVALRRKKDSSMRVALDLVKSGEASAAVSAGNSGAFMAIAMLVLRLLPGVERPAFATMMPSTHGPRIVLDVGANVDCQPHHLVQFAVMGEVFAHYMLDIERPKVGLLSNGEESSKGTELTRSAHEMLTKLNMNYGGYVEGRDIFTGDVHVVVTDGFTGNVLLKASEGIAKAITGMLREEIQANLIRKLGYLLASGAFRGLRKRIDYREVGGAPLLGINGNAIICHGSSNATAIRNAIRVASDLADKGVNLHMMKVLEQSEDTHHWASKKERRSLVHLKHKIIHHRWANVEQRV
jgi:glycerol-3-phosphate acyltransferase PlsX